MRLLLRRASPPWGSLPADGVVRVAPRPGDLPSLRDAVGRNRFDDPRPRTLDRYVVRYVGRTLRGCLLELLDWLRPDPDALIREQQVIDDGDLGEESMVVAAAQQVQAQALADYLATKHVGQLDVSGLRALSIDDPLVQAELDREPAVRALLDGTEARKTLGGSTRLHLDQAAVRLSSTLGRDITRACSLALRDRTERPDAIHYRSRHDDSEDCWAIYDHANVSLISSSELSDKNPSHRHAVQQVAELWDLSLPASWRTP